LAQQEKTMSAWEYIYLAVGSGILGVAITFVVVLVCQYFGIDMLEHLWLVAVPIVLSLVLNVTIIEIYRKIKKKH
jgi:purine-cytosine permease-like protein